MNFFPKAGAKLPKLGTVVILLLGLFLLASASGFAIRSFAAGPSVVQTAIQQNQNSAPTNPYSASFGTNVNPGDVVVVTVGLEGTDFLCTSVPSGVMVSDTAGDTYAMQSSASTCDPSNFVFSVSFIYTTTASSSFTTITVSQNSGPYNIGIGAYDVSGAELTGTASAANSGMSSCGCTASASTALTLYIENSVSYALGGSTTAPSAGFASISPSTEPYSSQDYAWTSAYISGASPTDSTFAMSQSNSNYAWAETVIGLQQSQPTSSVPEFPLGLVLTLGLGVPALFVLNYKMGRKFSAQILPSVD